jgi:uncharacterized protein DUF1097
VHLSSAALAAALVAAAAVLAFSQLPELFVWVRLHWLGKLRPLWRDRASSNTLFDNARVWCGHGVAGRATRLLRAQYAGSNRNRRRHRFLLIVIASRAAPLSVVPATFYGFASTFAYLNLSGGAFTSRKLISLGWSNAIFSVTASLLIGAALVLPTSAWRTSLLLMTPVLRIWVFRQVPAFQRGQNNDRDHANSRLDISRHFFKIVHGFIQRLWLGHI